MSTAALRRRSEHVRPADRVDAIVELGSIPLDVHGSPRHLRQPAEGRRMSLKRQANDRPVDKPTDERRRMRRSSMSANDRLTLKPPFAPHVERLSGVRLRSSQRRRSMMTPRWRVEPSTDVGAAGPDRRLCQVQEAGGHLDAHDDSEWHPVLRVHACSDDSVDSRHGFVAPGVARFRAPPTVPGGGGPEWPTELFA